MLPATPTGPSSVTSSTNGWSGKAAADSAAYRLTRTFRDIVSERVIDFVLVECYEADATFDYTAIRRREAAIWTIVNEQPQHLLDPQYAHVDRFPDRRSGHHDRAGDAGARTADSATGCGRNTTSPRSGIH